MRTVSLLSWIVGVVIGVVAIGGSAYGQDSHPLVLYFSQEGCPDCEKIRVILDEMKVEYPELTVGSYEITQPGNLDLLDDLASRFDVDALDVPTVFVGQESIIVGGELADRLELRAAIEACLVQGCPSLLDAAPANSKLRDGWILAVMSALFGLVYLLQGG